VHTYSVFPSINPSIVNVRIEEISRRTYIGQVKVCLRTPFWGACFFNIFSVAV